MLEKKPNTKIKQHEIYKEYINRIRAQSEEVVLTNILAIEQEKLLYFILAYPQKLVLVKTGNRSAEKRFLGYEFSNRRGSEGIHPIQRSKSIDECTHLYDEDSFTNPEKASTYIYKAFKGKFDLELPENLQKNLGYQNLVDMMTFDRADFIKNISLSAKKKINYDALWKTSSLVFVSKIADIHKGETITEDKTVEGNIPVIAGGQSPAYYHNEANREGNIITVSASGAYAGYINYFEAPIFASDCNTIKSKNEEIISTKLIFYYLKSIQNVVYKLQRGQAQPHVYADDLSKVRIPVPLPSVQQKIISEIEVLEEMEDKVVKKIEGFREEINNYLSTLYTNSKKFIRLTDDAFEVKIGKRVLKRELKDKGKYPVYSANVFEPFGYIDKELLTDFTLPSVVWGIDGDWMVNILPTETPFYPTDHCGYIRVVKPIIEVKYLAFALKIAGKEKGFSRNKRASINRIQGVRIPLPPVEEQKNIVAKIKLVEENISELEKQLAETSKQKEAILKKYLK